MRGKRRREHQPRCSWTLAMESEDTHISCTALSDITGEEWGRAVRKKGRLVNDPLKKSAALTAQPHF